MSANPRPSAPPRELVDLRDNTNLWGPPPSAVAAFRGLDPAAIGPYPGPTGGRLLPALARYLEVREEEVTVGCGSDELIDAAFRLAGPGAPLRYLAPTFSMVPVYGLANRLVPCPIPIDKGGGIPRGFPPSGAGPGLLYLCTPNNPTGTTLPAGMIREAIATAAGDALVVIDSAYADFAGEPPNAWMREAIRSGRTLVLRTFSKAWGLAGLRIGYAAGSPELVARLVAIRSPYNLNAVAERVALAALERDGDWVRARAREAAESRDRLLGRLRERGRAPWDSAANFVLLPVANAAEVVGRLLERGVAVRPFPGLPVIGDAVRIGVGPWPMVERFLDALEEVLPCG
ncbi:MAG: pyridoxal phosphate-dependent aminotransferase [Gemmatimonadales bacterium]